jgi:hypothetical protein
MLDAHLRQSSTAQVCVAAVGLILLAQPAGSIAVARPDGCLAGITCAFLACRNFLDVREKFLFGFIWLH